MSKEKDFARDLIEFIEASPSSFHAVKTTKDLLDENGFKELSLKDGWKLETGGKYYTIKNNSALVAFVVGEGELEDHGFKLIGGHTDSPTFRVKPISEILDGDGFLRLNTEVYGGPILNTWLDRPLSLAGRVSLRGESVLCPVEKLVDFEKPFLTIPNLAIHMNREANTGFKLNAQSHTLPLVTMVDKDFKKEGFLMNQIAKKLEVEVEDILDFELFLYATEAGELVGLEEEFISVGKLDDLAMVHAGMNALIKAKPSKATNLMIAFDNEEVGSETKQGAASPMLKKVLRRIALSLGKGEEEYYRALEHSFLISADQAHSVHPSYKEKADPTNYPVINRGPSIKVAANQAYTTDSSSSAVYEEVCNRAGVPVQKFTNRSDARGGSTIGPISSTQLDIASVDIGNPILAMHSVRELGGVYDHYYVYKSFIEFYSL